VILVIIPVDSFLKFKKEVTFRKKTDEEAGVRGWQEQIKNYIPFFTI
jgi:hypothetical protein